MDNIGICATSSRHETEFSVSAANRAVHLVPLIGRLVAILPSGQLLIEINGTEQILCDCVTSVQGLALAQGDSLLITLLGNGIGGVVLGRVGRYLPAQQQTHLKLQATESVTLQCGESSMTLRADGKVMVKGEDVLIRAKGTQRIRAGNVAIN